MDTGWKGRLGNPEGGQLINAILADHGLPTADVDGADGTVQLLGM